jgi:hypothetical protein
VFIAVAVDIAQLSPAQFALIYNLFSLAFAALAFTSLYLLVSRSTVLGSETPMFMRTTIKSWERGVFEKHDEA